MQNHNSFYSSSSPSYFLGILAPGRGSPHVVQISSAIKFMYLQVLHLHLSLSVHYPIFTPPLLGILFYTFYYCFCFGF